MIFLRAQVSMALKMPFGGGERGRGTRTARPAKRNSWRGFPSRSSAHARKPPGGATDGLRIGLVSEGRVRVSRNLTPLAPRSASRAGGTGASTHGKRCTLLPPCSRGGRPGGGVSGAERSDHWSGG